MAEPKITKRKITDYKPDPANPNAGTERGYRMVDDSFRENGAGRSLVVAADDTIVAGNTSQEVAVDAGFENVIEVETDGKTVVVVKRTDWPSIDDPKARRYSLADNRTSNFMQWDASVLAALQAENAALLDGLWYDDELAELLAGLNSSGEQDSTLVDVPEQYMILIECDDEFQQADYLERFAAEGLKCRALIS